ncbi:uncharacterized protein PHALS_02989 [Plasmopara halstedii]|uniref:Uncharacterized protein n=1 Tax=Plasmopara halstedii TaxID=4781 RepID=A0A0P1A7H2_PLAHL|nr:uncharacterized protein PHALS_02989 [Plasmopara halstedii]CEG36439.1 hypothetical protein PHALS_02989 [Plasmopara halstedii]|eukprot:XP_024572808.1 hypothetical protein PHALS_02989 [Plasmopara halstedii]
MTLEDSGNEDEEDFMGEIIDNFASLDTQIERSELEEFVHIDDENNEEYSKAILEDVDEMLETLTHQNDPSAECVTFHGFEQLHKATLEIEDQLLCSEVMEEAGDMFNDLRISFESFQQKLRQVTIKVKRKKCKMPGK